MVLLRIGVETGDESSPHVAQINAVAGHRTRAVRLAFILIRGAVCLRTSVSGKMFLRRERSGQVAFVRECIGDTPLCISLTTVRERFSLQRVVFMPQHTVLKFGKGSLLLRLIVPKERAFSVEVTVAPASPCSLGKRKHIGIEIVFVKQLSGVVNVAVVPERHDAAGYVVITLWLIENPTVEECHKVSVIVEVVGIMETAVYSRDARLSLATITPQLRHVYLALLIMPSGIP